MVKTNKLIQGKRLEYLKGKNVSSAQNMFLLSQNTTDTKHVGIFQLSGNSLMSRHRPGVLQFCSDTNCVGTDPTGGDLSPVRPPPT